MENIVNDPVTSSYVTDSNCTSGRKGLIMSATVEPLCCILETNLRLYINNTLIKKKSIFSEKS